MVYWSDFFIDKVVDLIKIRKKYDIHSESIVNIITANQDTYTAIIDDKLMVCFGNLPVVKNPVFVHQNVLIQEMQSR